MSIAWIVAGLAVAAANAASASQVRVVRYGDDRLTGITQVDVVVSITGDVGRCPIDRARLQQAAVVTLRASQVEATVSEKASSWFYSVLVTAHAAAVGGSCACAISAELIAQVDGIPEADRHAAPGAWGSLLVGGLSLIRETAMVTSPAPEHPGPVETVLRAQIAAIGARISAANR
jgi:hypothetical protein